MGEEERNITHIICAWLQRQHHLAVKITTSFTKPILCDAQLNFEKNGDQNWQNEENLINWSNEPGLKNVRYLIYFNNQRIVIEIFSILKEKLYESVLQMERK